MNSIGGVAVDGSNLAGTTDGIFVVRRLRLAVEQIESELNGRLDLAVFADANLRHHAIGADRVWLDAATGDGRVRMAPAGINADGFILDWAHRKHALVISNDRFREFEAKYPWLKAQGAGRCVTAMFDASLGRWTFLERRPGHRPPRSLSELISSGFLRPDSSGDVAARAASQKQPVILRQKLENQRREVSGVPANQAQLSATHASGRSVGATARQRFDSISVSINDTVSLAARLSERSAEGWNVVSIVQSGAVLTAYLSLTVPGSAAEAPIFISSTAADVSVVTGTFTGDRVRQSPSVAQAVVENHPSGWYDDPAKRFELRYWDGAEWTEYVSREGRQYTDPPVA